MKDADIVIEIQATLIYTLPGFFLYTPWRKEIFSNIKAIPSFIV